MKIAYAKTSDAIGKVLSHDVTRIVQGKCKGPAFKKGHVIKEEDVPQLLDIGKEHIYFLELEEDEVHENEAGLALAEALAGEGLRFEGPSEGRVDLVAEHDGLLKVDKESLYKINRLKDVAAASLHTNSPVKKGESVAGMRVIPLAVNRKILQEVEDICSAYTSVIKVHAYRSYKIGAVITGKEIYDKRVKDAFAPALKDKLNLYGLDEPQIQYVPDNSKIIAEAIQQLLGEEHDFIIVTGGMSVDPDDVTPIGIRESGAEIEEYGIPVLPGAMFLLAYHEGTPVVGVPACGMFYHSTAFDLIFPRLLAGNVICADDLAALGHGGFCRRCEKCNFPHCSFGK